MSLIELPSKAAESASALTVEKMKICFEILKISYEKKMSVKEVGENYTTVFNLLKDLTPPEQTAHFIKRHYKLFSLLITLSCFCFLICGTLFIGKFLYSLGILRKLF